MMHIRKLTLVAFAFGAASVTGLIGTCKVKGDDCFETFPGESFDDNGQCTKRDLLYAAIDIDHFGEMYNDMTFLEAYNNARFTNQHICGNHWNAQHASIQKELGPAYARRLQEKARKSADNGVLRSSKLRRRLTTAELPVSSRRQLLQGPCKHQGCNKREDLHSFGASLYCEGCFCLVWKARCGEVPTLNEIYEAYQFANDEN